ncbi:hypothetical protein RYX36_029873 [Vicia faba]
MLGSTPNSYWRNALLYLVRDFVNVERILHMYMLPRLFLQVFKQISLNHCRELEDLFQFVKLPGSNEKYGCRETISHSGKRMSGEECIYDILDKSKIGIQKLHSFSENIQQFESGFI